MEAVTIGQISTVSSLTTSDYIEVEQSGVSKKATLSALTAIIPTPAADPIRGYIDGLICSNAADTEHDISIAAGVAADSTNGYWLELSSALVKQIDAAWAAGTNAGGLDTGSVATASTYYIWLIRKDSDETIDALFSLSSTAPTVPAGYTYKRRIMTVVTDGSANIIPTDQIGDRIAFKQPIQDRTLSALASTNRTAYALSVPPGVIAICEIFLSASSTPFFFWAGPSTRPDASASETNYDQYLTAAGPESLRYEIVTDSSRQIYARGSSTSLYMGITTRGWIDDRGKDA